MGNDGGSIPDRRDLVRNKPKAEQADKANQTRARWFFCALSKRKLQEPIVSCALGKLYNKDAILEFLLDRSTFGDGDTICGHIRSLKDVKQLKLTPNPTPPSPGADAKEHPQFICPFTMKEMNGVIPFVYLSTCGCAFSREGLKQVGSSPGSSSDSEQLDVCPQCQKKYSRARDVLTLNPTADEEEKMREAMDAREAAEPAPGKKSKKRKAADEGEKAEAKKAKAAREAPTVSAAVVSALAMEEAKRKSGQMSDAVKSLYNDPNKKNKGNWTTQYTFTRVRSEYLASCTTLIGHSVRLMHALWECRSMPFRLCTINSRCRDERRWTAMTMRQKLSGSRTAQSSSASGLNWIAPVDTQRYIPPPSPYVIPCHESLARADMCSSAALQ
ncbi:Rtf2 RING-finger-domain-containing protein [Schizophyllum amplum]|uniref:Rtf2 RING-finger-domain-containing protein n=1 Tax=Schizophyllum amplum TaxID=97359 RepID=A0A550CDD3_9AGAR|nr:Rtf2 RING-finger-domain-containing protein [Auriculariopsis ampla]